MITSINNNKQTTKAYEYIYNKHKKFYDENFGHNNRISKTMETGE